MFRYPFIQLGRLLDRVDLGGWLMLGCGAVIVGATVLTPAWIEVAQLQSQRDLLAWKAKRLEIKHANYVALNWDIELGEATVLHRLAWNEYQLKPVATEALCDLRTIEPVSTDAWVQPVGPPPPAPTVAQWGHDSRLLRMLTGAPRPWVLAFGGWLILMGLLLNPVMEARGAAIDFDEDEDWADDEDEAAEPLAEFDGIEDEAEADAQAGAGEVVTLDADELAEEWDEGEEPDELAQLVEMAGVVEAAEEAEVSAEQAWDEAVAEYDKGDETR